MAKVTLYSRMQLTYIGADIMPNVNHTRLYLYNVGLQIRKQKTDIFPFSLENTETVH